LQTSAVLSVRRPSLRFLHTTSINISAAANSKNPSNIDALAPITVGAATAAVQM
jgi:hypothetical protein